MRLYSVYIQKYHGASGYVHVTAPQIYLLHSLGSVDILTGFLPADLLGTDYLRRVSQGLHRVHLPAGSTQGEPNGYR